MYKKHPLTEEFPEFAEKIHTLKVDDEHFKKLYDEYDEVDHEIYRIESDAEPASGHFHAHATARFGCP